MTEKLQRILVEVEYVFNTDEEDGAPLTRPLELQNFIADEVHVGNFVVRKVAVHDYVGDDDSLYPPIYCTPGGCAECKERINCLVRKPEIIEEPDMGQEHAKPLMDFSPDLK